MIQLLNANNQGIPLNILSTDGFDSWLSQQNELVQNWLKQTQFKGAGLSLIPDHTGTLTQVVFVVETPEHFFSCGELAKQLPAGQYSLKADVAYHEAIAFSWAIGCYQFDVYKTVEKPQVSLGLVTQELADKVLKQVEATGLVRDLINMPPADMMPEHLAQTMSDLAEQFGADMSQLIGDELLEHNYPTIHAVGRASCHKPRLLDLTWGDEKHPKVTLVGKGVCFDSGGLDLKPKVGMRNMKKDMGGAAHVIGLAQLIMANNLPVRLRVLVPAVENAVSSNALRPGDVVKTRQGLTVEIDNTDAEGRLVLCDALNEAQNDDPELLIDFATLTGAMRIALGTELPGFFSTNRKIAHDIIDAGDDVFDPVWQMPLYQPYKELFKSEVADMTNCPTVPQGAAICAALYLQYFVDEKTDWLHFDVMAWNNRKLSGRPLGGEAFGIRAVYSYLASRFNT